jgi:hypothetical protein
MVTAAVTIPERSRARLAARLALEAIEGRTAVAAFEHSVVIQRPIEDVFTFLHEPANAPKWRPSLAESRQNPEGTLGVGTTVTDVVHFLGRTLELSYGITKYDPPHGSAIESTSGAIRLSGSYELETVNGGTRVTMRGETDAHGFFRLAEPVFARFARRAANLTDLLELAE